MTLSEIETILEQLSARHAQLTPELLTTLLQASGWEEKTIKEALVLLSHKKNSLPLQQSTPSQQPQQIPQGGATVATEQQEKAVESSSLAEGITFYHPDGSEEGVLATIPDAAKVSRPVAVVEKKVIFEELTPQIVSQVAPIEIPEVVQKVEEQHVSKITEHTVEPPVQSIIQKQIEPIPLPAQELSVVPQTVVQVSKEPESLISHVEAPEKKLAKRQEEIPSNLPLLPFESSPHIWSFARYKDFFHGETPIKEEIKLITVMPVEEKTAPVVIEEKPKPKVVPVKVEEDVVLEKIPLTKGDESLVFLAGVMLLVIILILGYMYSNGRL